MGGAFETYGNVTLSAEYNIFVDPDAVDITLNGGVPVTFVPLVLLSHDSPQSPTHAHHVLSSNITKYFILYHLLGCDDASPL